MTIRYATNKRKADTIYYGNEEKLNNKIITNSGIEKNVSIKGLLPGTRYRYRIGLKGKSYNFQTAADKLDTFIFSVCGDYSHGGNRNKRLRLFQSIRKEHPDFLLFTGDIISNGNEPFTWKNEFFETIGNISPCLPLLVTRGNHEGKGRLFNYFFRNSGSPCWYKLSYANTLFVVLDTESKYIPGSPQYEFISKTLQESTERWKIVCLHKSPYSTNKLHLSNRVVRRCLCPMFEKFSVDLVFAGHCHGYERTYPIFQEKVNEEKGVTYITTGGGGAALTPFVAWKRLTDIEKQWCNVRAKVTHYILVRVETDKMSIAVKDLKGKIVDQFECVKRS
jgi:Predicted phosphohydrolases